MNFQLNINKDYAAKYNIWRQKEEYNKLKDKYGEEEDSSSSEESEDDDAEALTDQIEQDWLKTLSALKSKDPKIYQKDASFYHDIEETNDEKPQVKKKVKKVKPVTAQDYARRILAKKERELDLDKDSSGEENISDEEESEDNDEDDDEDIAYKQKELSEVVPGYYEEQEEIKKSFVDALIDNVDQASDPEVGLLTKRSHTTKQQDKQEADYIEWLKGQKSPDHKSSSIQKDLTSLRDYWNKPDLGESERFLRDYILNKRYLTPHSEGTPHYEDIVADEEENVDDGDEEDEDILEEQDMFEKKYNFRFEEPDQEFIKKHPRIINDSLRKDDKKRAKKRKAEAQRKDEAKQKRHEEIKQLKNLKRMEIEEKIKKLKTVTGNKKLGFDVSELDGDFDPTRYDSMMQEAFSSYDDQQDDVEKPVFEYDKQIDDEVDWDSWEVGGDNEEWREEDGQGGQNTGQDDLHCEDEEFNMDADYDPSIPRESKKSKRKMKNSKFVQLLLKKKPAYNPEDKSFDEYYKEYYDLDYEDIVGDMPCRFTYRQVQPNDYGLEMSEILMSRDQELNKWNSFKAMNQIKNEDEETYLVHKFRKRGRNENMKRQVLPALFATKKSAERKQLAQSSDRPGKCKTAGNRATMTTTGKSNHLENSSGELFEKKAVNLYENKKQQMKTSKKAGENVAPVVTNTGTGKIKKDESVKKNTNIIEVSRKAGPMKITVISPIKTKGNKPKTMSNQEAKRPVKSTNDRSTVVSKGVTGDSDAGETHESLGGDVGNVTEMEEGRKSRRHRRAISQRVKGTQSGRVKKKKKKDLVISDERLKAYGVTNVKQFRYAHKCKDK